MKVWLVVSVVVVMVGRCCLGLGFVAVPGLPLVGPGALGAFPVAALLSLQAAVLIALLKEGKTANTVLDYLLNHDDYDYYDYPQHSYDHPPPTTHYKEPEPSYGHQESSYATQESSYAHVYRQRQKRSTSETGEVVEVEKLLVSAAARLDRGGCMLKMFCHLHNKGADYRSQEENVLHQLFSTNPETLSSYNAALASAKEAGQNMEQATCDQVFPRCPLTEEELNNLIWRTVGCGNMVR